MYLSKDESDSYIINVRLVGCSGRHGAVMTIEDIKRVSADECGVMVSDIDGRGRAKQVSLARSIAIYLSRLKTGKTCVEIGKAFDRDHSQVSSTWKNYSGYIETDSSLQSLVKKVEAKLG